MKRKLKILFIGNVGDFKRFMSENEKVGNMDIIRYSGTSYQIRGARFDGYLVRESAIHYSASERREIYDYIIPMLNHIINRDDD